MYSIQSAQFAIEAADGALPLVPPAEREDAERLLAICRDHWHHGLADDGTRTRELGRLVEVLARRSAQAMPFAALGRALIAELHNDPEQTASLLNEFQLKLSQLGL